MTKTQQLIHDQFATLQPHNDFILAPRTYFKIGGPAEVFLELKTRADLIAVVQFCHREHLLFTILGGASNVIISDEGLRGVVIEVANEEYEAVSKHGRGHVRAGSGCKTALFVRQTIDSGFKGLEYFLGVPGKLGGAIYNNAHYLQHLLGQHITRVEVITPAGEVRWLTHEECEFAYDSSRFHHSHEVIVQAEFTLEAGDQAESMQLIKEATLYRAKSQPLGQPSSGCYFRNTPNTPTLQQRFPQFKERREFPTAFLIDQLGLKGTKLGGIQVSEKHAAFLINTGGGTSAEVAQLAERIKQRVSAEFGVQLEPEVFWLGPRSNANV